MMRVFVMLSLLLCPALPMADPGKSIINSIGMVFALIPVGSFAMGADRHFDRQSADRETPQHKVVISQPFYMGKHEVTQGQWMAVMNNNPSGFKGQSLPVERVSWQDAQIFVQRLNAKEGHQNYRLPTEAEWEYVARAGTETTRYWGDAAESMDRYAWYGFDQGNANRQTHPVGQLQPNAWGLHDMLGNVEEWVSDWYGERYYTDSPSRDPTGPGTGSYRVIRGGSWYNAPAYLRVTLRNNGDASHRYNGLGLRLVMMVR
ncbi:MAG: formylglycine-generating enzyme family protein [Magnetococcus sp. MYC-9]